jgi:hypothetical protein
MEWFGYAPLRHVGEHRRKPRVKGKGWTGVPAHPLNLRADGAT